MAEPDKIYSWLGNVITSCYHPSHIKPCEMLINFYEQKGGDKDLIKALRYSLELKEQMIKEKGILEQQLSREEQVWNMFQLGKWTQKEISDRLDVKVLKVQEIISRKMKENM